MNIQGRINTTEVARQNENFKSLDLDFLAHPASGDLVKKVGVESIKRSLRNLLLLKRGELGFNPNKGSGIHFALFQPFSPSTVELLNKEIINTIKAFEPRVSVIQIIMSDENLLDKNGLNIDIIFSIMNYNDPVKMSLFLERIR